MIVRVRAIIISRVHGDIGVSNRQIINGVHFFSTFFFTNKISTAHLIRVLYTNNNNNNKTKCTHNTPNDSARTGTIYIIPINIDLTVIQTYIYI